MCFIDQTIDIDRSQWLDISDNEKAKSTEHAAPAEHAEETDDHSELLSLWHKAAKEQKNKMKKMKGEYTYSTGVTHMKKWASQAMSLSGHGKIKIENSHDREHLTNEEIKEYELGVFYVARTYHLISFLVILLNIQLKRVSWFVYGQALQSLWITVSMFLFSYVIYIVKMNFGTWDFEMNYIRAWLLIEVIFFFKWIISGIIFLLIGKTMNFHPIQSDEDADENDEDVWNDRKSQDFLVHLKSEYFHFSYMCTLFLMTLVIGFSNFYFMGVFGPRDFYPTTSINLLIVCYRFLILFLQLWNFHQKKHLSTACNVFNLVILLIHFAVTGLFIYWYHKSDFLVGQNIFCQVWTFCMAVSMCIEPFYFIGREMTKKIKFLDPNANKDADNDFDADTLNTTGGNNEVKRLDSMGKSVKTQETEKLINTKDTLEMSEDFVSLTVLCYIKENVENKMIGPEKRGQMLFNALMVQCIVFIMLWCMFISIVSNENGRYTNEFSHSFAVFYLKFPCAIALHLMLYPEVAKGLNIMKFCNKQSHLFVEWGSEIGYMLGFVQALCSIWCEVINIYLLTYQHNVEHCIIHFVALEIIVEIGKMYLESLQKNPLKALLHHPPKITKFQKDFKEEKLSCFHKVARFLFVTIRTLYVSVIFYFVPFAVLFWQWATKLEGEDFLDSNANHAKAGGSHGEHGGH